MADYLFWILLAVPAIYIGGAAVAVVRQRRAFAKTLPPWPGQEAA
jgi:hypothetical protein